MPCLDHCPRHVYAAALLGCSLAARGYSKWDIPVAVVLLITYTTHEPATDLGFMLQMNPGRFWSFKHPLGQAFCVPTQNAVVAL